MSPTRKTMIHPVFEADESSIKEEFDRPIIEPEIEKRVLDVFNDVWYDFDVEEGMINKSQFKQIMGYCKSHIGFKPK
jgi:hypothetical protein